MEDTNLRPQEVQVPVEEDRWKEVRKYFFLILILAVVSGGAYLLHLLFRGEAVPPQDPFADVSGNIYFTAAEVSFGKAAGLYVLDLGMGTVSKHSETGFVNYTESFSVTGDQRAFLTAPLDLETDLPFMYSTRLDLVVEDQLSGSRVVTETPEVQAGRLPRFSPDGTRVAYAGLTMDGNFHNPDDWRVMVHEVDTAGSDTFFTTGTYPQWSPDGTQLLVLRGDGLYLQDTVSTSTERVLGIPYTSYGVSTTFSLSPDKSVLAVSDAEKRRLFVYNVSWSPFNLRQRGTVTYDPDELMFWPVFSPDGKYFAVFYAKLGEQDRISGTPSIYIFDVESLSFKEAAMLNGYDPELFMLTEWRQQK